MQFSEWFSTNDSAPTAASKAAEGTPAHSEVWTTMKDMVTNKTASKIAPTVLIGDAGWGTAQLSAVPNAGVEGLLEGERTTMHRTGQTQFSGDTPWSATDLKFQNGKLAGVGPWGKISVNVTANELRGDIPWGKIQLSLKGQELSGPTPWGTAHLRLGDNYQSLTDPAVLTALTAVLSEK